MQYRKRGIAMFLVIAMLASMVYTGGFQVVEAFAADTKVDLALYKPVAAKNQYLDPNNAGAQGTPAICAVDGILDSWYRPNGSVGVNDDSVITLEDNNTYAYAVIQVDLGSDMWIDEVNALPMKSTSGGTDTAIPKRMYIYTATDASFKKLQADQKKETDKDFYWKKENVSNTRWDGTDALLSGALKDKNYTLINYNLSYNKEPYWKEVGRKDANDPGVDFTKDLIFEFEPVLARYVQCLFVFQRNHSTNSYVGIHDFNVYANNIPGTAVWSDGDAIVLQPDGIEGQTDGIGADKVALTWDIAKYAVSYKLKVTNTSSGDSFTIDVSGTSKVVEGLAPNTEYKFEVQAFGSDGTAVDGPSITVTTKKILDWTENGKVTEVKNDGGGEVTVSWPAATVGDSGNYKLTVVNKDNPSDTQTLTIPFGTNEATVTGLTEGSVYEFTVTAVSGDGFTSTYSCTGTIQVFTLIASPTNLYVTNNTTGTSLTLNWTPPAIGVPVYYVIYQDNAVITDSVYANVYSYNVTGLTPGTTYTFKVEAKNESGQISNSNGSNVVTVTTFAPVTWPEGAKLSFDRTKNSVTLTWPAAAGSVENYAVYQGSVLLVDNLGKDVLTYTINNLTYGETYQFKVLAKDTNGQWTSTGPEGEIKITFTPVSWPANASLTANRAGSAVVLTWTPANGDVTNYAVYQDGKLIADNIAANVLTYTVSNLTATQAYTFEVKAQDVGGNWTATSLKVEVAGELELENLARFKDAGASNMWNNGTPASCMVDGLTGTYVRSLSGNSSTKGNDFYVSFTIDMGEEPVKYNKVVAIPYNHKDIATSVSIYTSNTKPSGWATKASTLFSENKAYYDEFLNDPTKSAEEKAALSNLINQNYSYNPFIPGSDWTLVGYADSNLDSVLTFTFDTRSDRYIQYFVTYKKPNNDIIGLYELSVYLEPSELDWLHNYEVTITNNNGNGNINVSWPAADVGSAGNYTLTLVNQGDASDIHTFTVPYGTNEKLVEGLRPGATYSITVTATGPSNAVSTRACTGTVTVYAGDLIPSWPENAKLNAKVSDNSVTLSWPSAKGTVSEYEIYQNGKLIQTVKSNVTSYKVNNLKANTYEFEVIAKSNYGATSGLKVTCAVKGSSSTAIVGGGGGSYVSVPSTGANDIVLSSKNVSEGGKQTQIVTATEDSLKAAFNSIKDKAESEQVINIRTSGSGTDTVKFELPVQALMDAAQEVPGAVLRIQSDMGIYELPVSALNLDEIAGKVGGDAKDIKISLYMEKAPGEVIDILRNNLITQNLALVGSVMDYRVVAEGNTSIELDSFNTYISRTIEAGVGLNSSNTTGARFDPVTGELTFVPSIIEGTRVTFKSNRNSYYVVVTGNVTFDDIKSHWARETIEQMASKLLIKGIDSNNFAPDNNITRAEFATLIVKALGLAPDKAAANFTDVSENDWFAGYVGAAYKAGLISGIGDGKFAPYRNITRQEMAVLISKAIAYAGKKVEANTAVLSRFTDAGSISDWAWDAVAQAVEAGVISGMTTNTFVPAENATRAQAAVMLKNMLKFVGFIN